ncbi:putative mfs multidrug protein [Neofusicoccum parvum]|nr:putative mfs multidrug protein [Neofusicoccum parvum]
MSENGSKRGSAVLVDSPIFPTAPFSSRDLIDYALELAFRRGADTDITEFARPGVYYGNNERSSVHISKVAFEQVEDYGKVQLESGLEEDPNAVYWDNETDASNPMNWSSARKWTTICLLSLITLVTPLASSMFAPGVPQVLRTFDSTNDILATLVVSIYILGFALGPLVIAPLSEMFGRVPLYNVSNVGFVAFTVACAAAQSLNMLIIFRFFAGCFGAACLTIGGGTIADLMPPEKRGGAMAVWATGPLLGPVIGPICGGFLVEAMGWRWVFWLLAILAGAISVACLICFRETYAPIILARKAARLREESGNPDLRSKLDMGLTKRELLRRATIRPTKMLVRSPIVAAMSLYSAFIFGILYLLFATFTFVFEKQYGFGPSIVGLAFIGIGVGMLMGLVLVGTLSDASLKRTKARGEPLKPEHRLPAWVVLPALCLPVGLLVYGWTAQYHVHWAVPIAGTMVIGFGGLCIHMCIQTYLVDAFTAQAASALAANSVLRSVSGALLPLASLNMYDKLGLNWGNSLLAFIGIALIPVPLIFRLYGERIRASRPVDL